MKPITILKRARKLISSLDHWTKGASALTKRGVGTSPLSPAAVSFCSLGALARAAGTAFDDKNRARGFLKRAIKRGYVAAWNDAPKRTHTQVLAAFDRAIALAEKASAE